ncbi:MAG: MTAP family purine nucleoside phosphorylase [Planctomycetes bacterium]|nr:MTAP family purine nucleoside phosphorylase [Planctomycetota bacterium]
MKEEIKIGVIARVGSHNDLIAAGASETDCTIRETPFGPSNPVHRMKINGRAFALISRHGEKGYDRAAPWVNDRANLYALKDLGVERIVSFSSPGSLDPGIGAGDLFLPDDVLDERREGPFSFFEGRGVGVIRLAHPFCTGLNKAYGRALEKQGFQPRMGGVYVGTQGPRLETPVEIRKLRMLGGTVVGMTLVPEVFLARELELCYGAVCLVVNNAEGMRKAPYQRNMLFEGLATEEEMNRVRSVEERIGPMLAGLIDAAARYNADCDCRHALARYKTRGDLSADWRKWWD